jgi:hypothetical protein
MVAKDRYAGLLMGLPSRLAQAAAKKSWENCQPIPSTEIGTLPRTIRLGMPSCEPSASEAAKDYRERYEELTGCSLWECPVCHQGRMLVIKILPRSPHWKTATTDTS